MHKKLSRSKYDQLILDLVNRFKIIEKKHIYCLLKSCKKNSKIEERLKLLVEKKKIYKCFYQKKKNVNVSYFCKNEPVSKKAYWVKKTPKHTLVVEQIAFLKEISGCKITCEDYIPNSKVRYDIQSQELNGSVCFYEIELSKKNKYEIREKIHEYILIGEVENLKFIFNSEDNKNKAIKHLNEFYDLLKYEPMLISDYGISLDTH